MSSTLSVYCRLPASILLTVHLEDIPMGEQVQAKGKGKRWTGGPFRVAKTVDVNEDLGKLLKQLHSTQAEAATAVREFITLSESGLKKALEARIKTAKLKAATEALREFDPKVAAAALKALEDEKVEARPTPTPDKSAIGGDPRGQGKTPGEGK